MNDHSLQQQFIDLPRLGSFSFSVNVDIVFMAGDTGTCQLIINATPYLPLSRIIRSGVVAQLANFRRLSHPHRIGTSADTNTYAVEMVIGFHSVCLADRLFITPVERLCNGHLRVEIHHPDDVFIIHPAA